MFAAAIFGRHGGPSSTSVLEAYLTLCWSSAARRRQVVRPRRPQAGRWQRFIAGGERLSIPLSDLGVHSTLRSPAVGGGDAQGLDCFSSFSSRVFSVRVEALSSNIRFVRASVVKGPLYKMYPPLVMI